MRIKVVLFGGGRDPLSAAHYAPSVPVDFETSEAKRSRIGAPISRTFLPIESRVSLPLAGASSKAAPSPVILPTLRLSGPLRLQRKEMWRFGELF
jgi:hypothetical protein